MQQATFGASPPPPPARSFPCAYHPNNLLTNFCTHPQCLMPLCPCCLVQHTQQHITSSQTPQYLQLHTAITQSIQTTYQHIHSLQQLQSTNQQIKNYIDGLEEYVHRQLERCKEEIVREIDGVFRMYQEEVVSKVREKYQREGVYDRVECQEVAQYIAQQIAVMYARVSELKGEDCLAALIRLHQHEHSHITRGITQVQKHLTTNSNAGGITLSLVPHSTISPLLHLLQQHIQLSFIPPNHSQDTSTSSQPVRKSWMERNITSEEAKIGKGSRDGTLRDRNRGDGEVGGGKVGGGRGRREKIRVESRASGSGSGVGERGKMEYSRIVVGDVHQWRNTKHF